jgi:hypothetical protein
MFLNGVVQTRIFYHVLRTTITNLPPDSYHTPCHTAASAFQHLRYRISSIAPGLNTSLANWWNVYDAFNVWRTYKAGDVMPDLDPKTYDEVCVGGLAGDLINSCNLVLTRKPACAHKETNKH